MINAGNMHNTPAFAFPWTLVDQDSGKNQTKQQPPPYIRENRFSWRGICILFDHIPFGIKKSNS